MLFSNHHKENRQDSRQEIREPKRNHKTERIVKQVIENIKKKEWSCILIKKMKDQWQSYLACFLPQARRIFSPFPLALSSYPSSYSSLGVFVAIGAIFPGKPLPPFDVHHISSMASLCCSSHQQHGFPVSCSWSHAWRGVPPTLLGCCQLLQNAPFQCYKKDP